MFCSFFLSFFFNIDSILKCRIHKDFTYIWFKCWSTWLQDLNILNVSLSWIFFCQFRMGDAFKNVDTSKFRVATWNYIHLVYGIFHDDYQYVEVCTTSVVSKDWHKMVHCYSKILEILLDTVYWEVLPLYFGCVPILCHLSSHFTA